MKVGSYGMTMGHEMSHSLDPSSRKTDGLTMKSCFAAAAPVTLVMKISQKNHDDFDVNGQLDSIVPRGEIASNQLPFDVEIISNFSDIFMTKVTGFQPFAIVQLLPIVVAEEIDFPVLTRTAQKRYHDIQRLVERQLEQACWLFFTNRRLEMVDFFWNVKKFSIIK